MTFLTVSERKRRSAERFAAAAEAVMADLSAYARAKGSPGRFIVFGSAASGSMRYDSDFDVIVDFPPGEEAAAYNAVEDACGRHGLKADVLAGSLIDGSFIERVMKAPVRILP
ncbi:MAG TPA: nucleotidyltransferase domain-containing protein [Propylenella sp.]|nr:nucleotidyltransferase domain-containing protein [Propylenella sp.]